MGTATLLNKIVWRQWFLFHFVHFGLQWHHFSVLSAAYENSLYDLLDLTSWIHVIIMHGDSSLDSFFDFKISKFFLSTATCYYRISLTLTHRFTWNKSSLYRKIIAFIREVIWKLDNLNKKLIDSHEYETKISSQLFISNICSVFAFVVILIKTVEYLEYWLWVSTKYYFSRPC